MTGNVFDQAMAAAAGGGRLPVPTPMPEQDGGPSIFDQAMTAAAQIPPWNGGANNPELMGRAELQTPLRDMPNRLTDARKRVLGDATEWEKNLTPQGLWRGLVDLRDAGSQLIGRGLTAVAPKGSAFEQWAKDQTKIVEDRNAKGEAEYQASREGTGVDSGRLMGNVVAGLPFGVGATARSLPMRVAANTVTGGATAALTQPVPAEDSGDAFWQTKRKQAGLGAAGAVALMPFTGTASRVLSPNASTNPNVQTLINEGVRLTPGQMGGGIIKRAEDAATSTPLLGDAIRSSQRQGVEDLNRAALNRVLAPIGQELPADMRVGREAVEYVQNHVNDAYRNLLPRLQVQPDQQFVGAASRVLQDLQASEPEMAKQFGGIFQRQVVDRFASAPPRVGPWGAAPNRPGPISGETLKAMESELGTLATRYRTSSLASERSLGEALSETQSALRDLVSRSNPQYADELKKINNAFRQMVVTDKAAGAQGAVEGVFSPNQLSAAVKGSDRSARDRNFAAGRATMQDLSDPAKAIMPSSIPDSGTAARLFFNSGSLGQLALLPMALGAGAYTNLGRGAAEYLMARRPGMAQPLAQGLLGASPALGAAAAPSIYGLLQ